ncbi:MAG: hypothetical protein M3340_13585 [Actinomycetota bacterium]|nr:hypothetical protein [Actinomycetota bacterium]
MTYVDQMPSDADWAALTAVPEKRDAYARETYFREAWDDVVDVLGDSAAAVLGSLGLLSFKPEAVVGRRLRATLHYVVDHGFVPAGVARLRYTRNSMRELWRYNWDVYTVDRIALATLMHSATDTLLWLLRGPDPDDGVPAAVRLSELKGPAAVEERSGDHLRSVLRPPNEIVNFVHVADEPADIVRELGILLARTERRRLLLDLRSGLGGDLSGHVAAEIGRLEADHAAHDLSFAASLERLQRSGAASPETAELVRAAAGGERKLRWDELCALIDPSSPRVDVWDFVLVACDALPLERPGSTELLPTGSAADWTA